MRALALAALMTPALIAGTAQADTDTGYSSRADYHAPIGVMGDHTHEAGEWMLSYRFMQMNMDTLRDGMKKLSPSDVLLPNGTYMATPLEMTMQMHMLGAMYAPTDDVTLMAMVPYVTKDMDHRRANNTEFSTESAGLGDASLTALINFHNDNGVSAHFTLGVGLPTGDINQTDTPGHLPYPMQIGSGSYMAIYGVTVTSFFDTFSIGWQYLAKTPLNENENDYRVGSSFEVNAWAGFNVAHGVSLSARLSCNENQNYDGADSELMIPSTAIATADPSLRASRQLTGGLGANVSLGGGHRLAAEVELPIMVMADGPQLQTDMVITLGYQIAF